jgi:type I restriction enzyme S subunit
MKKYDTYKDSGIEWIGEIPSHWEKYRLGVIGKFTSSGIDKKLVDNEPEVKIINYTNIYGNGNSILDSSINYMVVTTPKSKIDEHSVKKGDLIFTPSSETKEDIGLSALVIEDLENTAFSYHVLRFQFDRNVDLNFKKYLCNNYFVLNHFSRNSQGTTRQTLGRNDFKTAEVILPSQKEQTAIAAYLDRKTAEIDELIADKKRLLTLYEEEKTAIINQAVTKGINPNVPMKDSGIEWLGEIPEHWEVKRLKYVAEINLGKMLTKEDKGEMYLKPYLRAANIGWLNVDVSDVKEMWFTQNELKKLRLAKNDLLVSEGGEVGRTCIWKNELNECYIQNSVHKITMNKDCAALYFLNQFYLFGQKGAFDLIVNRISIAHLTVEKLKEIEFIIPPLDEQRIIVQHIETECTRIAAKKTKTEKLIELLTEYRTALISEVVTGKIKVIP